MNIHIDGDFATDKPCKHHCSPSCHPAQVGSEWKYGCSHKAWPPNRVGDFVPIVNCDGKPKKCEIPLKLLRNMQNGLVRRVSNRKKAIEQYENEIAEMVALENEQHKFQIDIGDNWEDK